MPAKQRCKALIQTCFNPSSPQGPDFQKLWKLNRPKAIFSNQNLKIGEAGSGNSFRYHFQNL